MEDVGQARDTQVSLPDGVHDAIMLLIPWVTDEPMSITLPFEQGRNDECEISFSEHPGIII